LHLARLERSCNSSQEVLPQAFAEKWNQEFCFSG